MGHRFEIEDGMGFAGLVPSAAERAQEREVKAAVATAKRDLAIKVLTAARDAAVSHDPVSEHAARAGANHVRFAIQEVMGACGVDLDEIRQLTTTQQKEGE